MAAVTRRQYKGAAAQTTTTNALSVSDTSVTLTAVTGFPSTPAVPFIVVIDPGTSSEEKCSATISGSTLTLVRAQDDTTAATHTSGATIYPVFSADEADEANLFTSTMTTRGDLLTMGAGPTVARIAIGASGTVLKSDGTDASFGTVAAAGLATDSVTTVKIQDLAVTGIKRANATVSTKTASYTLVAADRNTKVVMNAGATNTTITVNTSLFAAGDTLEILNTSTSGTCTITAGTATVASAGSLALGLNQGGTLYFTSAGVSVFQADGVAAAAGGLTLLTAVSFTAQTTVAFANSLFSATYQNYQVFMELDTVSGSSNWTMQLRNNAGAISGALYYGGLIGTSYTGTTVNVGSSDLTAFNFGTATQDCNNIAMTVFNPFNNVRNTTWSGTTFNNNNNDLGGAFGGMYKAVAAYTGLQFNFSTTVTGTYRVYGLADA